MLFAGLTLLRAPPRDPYAYSLPLTGRYMEKKPRNKHNQYRDKFITFRVSQYEKEMLQELAAKTDARKPTSFARDVALGYPVKSIVTHEAINELRRLGGLVKHLFLEGGREDPNGMYLATLNDLRAAIKRLGRDQ